MQDHYEQFQELGAEVVALSTDTAEDAERIVETHRLVFPVAYDTDTAVTRQWGVFNLLGDGVATPATFIFDADGRLDAWRVGRDIGDRPTAVEVLEVLRKLEASIPRERSFGAPTAIPVSELPTAMPLLEEDLVDRSQQWATKPSDPAPAPPAPVVELGPGVHDFTLPTADGRGVTLSSHLGEQNVIIVFYRAWW